MYRRQAVLYRVVSVLCCSVVYGVRKSPTLRINDSKSSRTLHVPTFELRNKLNRATVMKKENESNDRQRNRQTDRKESK